MTEVDPDDVLLGQYKDVFAKFGENDAVAKEANAGNTGEVFFDQDDEIPSEDEDGSKARLSKKKRKNLKAAAHNQDPTRPDDAKCFGAF